MNGFRRLQNGRHRAMLDSNMSEKPSIPSDSEPIRLFYASAPCRGDSMRGTLADGDCLWIFPVPFDSLQVGDVVAFDSGGKVVVHRIVGREEKGFRTQGDGNWSRDFARLTSGGLIGKVMERERRGVRSIVVGGPYGRLRAFVLRTFCRLRLRLAFWLTAPYRLICASRVVSLVWRPRILSVCFVSEEGPITRFIHRGKIVATWMPQARQWECRTPYDLILSPPAR